MLYIYILLFIIFLKINAQSLKRIVNRKVQVAIAKRTRLEHITSLVNKRYIDSDSDDSDGQNGYNNRMNLCMDEEGNTTSNDEEDLNNERNEDIDLLNQNGNGNNEVESIITDNSDDSRSDPSPQDSHSSENNSDMDEEEHLQFANENERDQYIVRCLRDWVHEEGIMSMRKLDSLLSKLHRAFPTVPLSYKTLLQTPKRININEINGGELWYKGIEFNLDLMNLDEYLQNYNEILMDINIDGLPLFKSNAQRFWPILGKLVKSKNEPFVIAIFKGNQDPNMNDLLNEFVREMTVLQRNGYVRNGVSYRLSIRHYIFDAPARSKVKCCIEHGGYCACEKCEVVGEYVDNRMTYIELDANLRTDLSFLNQEQPLHHSGRSLLEIIGAGLVSQFRLDSLHLVYLGVFKRLILAWKKWNGPWRLHYNEIQNISQKLLRLKGSCPQDFNRPPRPLTDLSFYKATEFRRLLLYDGIVVLRDSLADEVYKHFLLLHCAIYILNSPSLLQMYCNYANTLLRIFISHSVAIYGQKFVTYNVHSLSHLAYECEVHGKLDDFSAFPFENKLQSIKASLRSGYKPLKQAAFRDLEKGRIDITLENENVVVLSQKRKEHIVNEVVNGTQFKKIHVNDVLFQCNEKDTCFKTYNNTIAVLRNIVQVQNEIYFIGLPFSVSMDLYEYPLPSSYLGIVKVACRNEERQIFLLTEIACKCWLIPDGDAYACIPLLHTMPLLK